MPIYIFPLLIELPTSSHQEPIHRRRMVPDTPNTAVPAGAAAIVNGLARSYVDSRFTDFTITSGAFQVHRLIISLQSSVLAKACYGSFRETSLSSIDLSDDEPACVQAMVEFFYRYFYVRQTSRHMNELEFHIRMAVIADKYDVQPLKDYASGELKNVLDAGTPDVETFAAILTTAHAYSTAIPKIYEQLLTLAVESPTIGIAAAVNKPLEQAMRDNPDLAIDIAKATHSRLVKIATLTDTICLMCPICFNNNLFPDSLFVVEQYTCNHCHRPSESHAWTRV